jgi:diacylglycerol kinase family enzyme
VARTRTIKSIIFQSQKNFSTDFLEFQCFGSRARKRETRKKKEKFRGEKAVEKKEFCFVVCVCLAINQLSNQRCKNIPQESESEEAKVTLIIIKPRSLPSKSFAALRHVARSFLNNNFHVPSTTSPLSAGCSEIF